MTYKEAHDKAVEEQQILDESETKSLLIFTKNSMKHLQKLDNCVRITRWFGKLQEGPGGWMSGTGYGQFTR